MTTSRPSTPVSQASLASSFQALAGDIETENVGTHHMAADVSQDLGLETKLADGLAVLARLLTGSGRSQFDVWYGQSTSKTWACS